jgi:hypothetical protein
MSKIKIYTYQRNILKWRSENHAMSLEILLSLNSSFVERIIPSPLLDQNCKKQQNNVTDRRNVYPTRASQR